MTVLITGSTRGLGAHIGKLFEAHGNAVVYHRRNQNSVIKAKNIITADLLDKKELDAELLRIKNLGFDVQHLICNAGQSSYPRDDLSGLENIGKALAENVIVTSNSMHSTLQHHRETLKTITIIGSICGEEYIDGAPIEYGIAKSTLRALNKASANYLSAMNIRCNMITPGNLMFEGSVWHRKLLADSSAVEAYLVENVPGGKIGVPQDIFDAIEFMISEKSNFLNGANIVLDGAQTRKW
jgi:NAD(P)-dependent dehydrogenase (short-subunit alcohol dehydrogenase family)